jgi:hypothetical protein
MTSLQVLRLSQHNGEEGGSPGRAAPREGTHAGCACTLRTVGAGSVIGRAREWATSPCAWFRISAGNQTRGRAKGKHPSSQGLPGQAAAWRTPAMEPEARLMSGRPIAPTILFRLHHTGYLEECELARRAREHNEQLPWRHMRVNGHVAREVLAG